MNTRSESAAPAQAASNSDSKPLTEIPSVLEALAGTSVYDALLAMEASYRRISREQAVWYEKTQFFCPDACGRCCMGFEPDLFEGEALYMAAWLLEHQKETALAIADGHFPFENGEKTCPLFNEESSYHCSIYGGRPFICRLFGASCSSDRQGKKVWRPCKFYPDQALAAHRPPLERRQYSQAETEALLGALPPLMSDMTEGERASADGSTRLLREALPAAIKQLLWLISMNGNDSPSGAPSPCAA